MVRAPTPEDLSLLPTRGELSYELPTVTWPDGSAVELTLRAISARDRAAIDRAAIAAASAYKGDYDDTTALVETVFAGIARPQLDEEHKAILWRWNVWILEQIADQIAILGRLPARELQAHLERLAGIAVPEPQTSSAGPRRKRRAPKPDSPTGNPAGDTPEPSPASAGG